jgi:hypothetical protein
MNATDTACSAQQQHSRNQGEMKNFSMGYIISYETGKIFQKQARVMRSQFKANIALCEIPCKYD